MSQVEGLVQVVAGPQPQRLAHGIDGLIRREHDDLDLRIDLLELLQESDAADAHHADVQDGDIDLLAAGHLQGRLPVAGHQQFVVVLEDHPERLAGALLVIHDQQRAPPAAVPGERRARSR